MSRHIEIQYYGPTNTKPARLALKTQKPTVFISRTFRQSVEEQAESIAADYARDEGCKVVAMALDRHNPDKWHAILGRV